MKSSLIEVDEEDTLNQTWAKSKCLDTNVNLDKTWLPEMKDEVDDCLLYTSPSPRDS